MPSDEEHVDKEVKIENDSSIIKWKILDNNEVLHAKKIPKIEPKSLLPIKEGEFEIYSIFLPNKFWEQWTTFTNQNANQYLERLEIQTRLKGKKYSKFHRWKPVTVFQLQQYVGIILVIGYRKNVPVEPKKVLKRGMEDLYHR